MSDNQSNSSPKRPMKERLWGQVNDQLLDVAHDDDIQEFDNPIPRWWKAIFLMMVFFAMPYLLFYHGGAQGRTAPELYSAAAAENARLRFAQLGGELKADEETLVKFSNDSSWLPVGKGVFQSNCATCHGRDGGGKIGPNLCDESFKNIVKIEDIYKVINKGAAAGAMPAWSEKLDQNELVLVSCYVASLRGSSPASPKAAEGVEIAAWPEYVPPSE